METAETVDALETVERAEVAKQNGISRQKKNDGP